MFKSAEAGQLQGEVPRRRRSRLGRQIARGDTLPDGDVIVVAVGLDRESLRPEHAALLRPDAQLRGMPKGHEPMQVQIYIVMECAHMI